MFLQFIVQTKKECYNLPIKQGGKTKYTWVNRLPEKLLHLAQTNGGTLDSSQVAKLKQNDRALVVSIALHPLTAKKINYNMCGKF